MENNVSEYLTIKEASELIRTPVATLYQWSYTKKGPTICKVGKRLLYNRAQLLAWVEAQAVVRP